MKKVYYYSLLTLLILLGIGALFGGIAMIIDPSGKSLSMPISMLKYSPFKSFLFPGIMLTIFFGIWPLLLIRPLIKKTYSRFCEGFNLITDMHWAWTHVIYLSFGLIIWIQFQMEFIKDVHWVHTLYTMWGIFMIALALMPGIRKRFKKE